MPTITEIQTFVEASFPVRFPEYQFGSEIRRPKGWSKLQTNIYNRARHGQRHYVLCGGKNNIVVVDLDRLKSGEAAQGKKDGVEWLKFRFDDPDDPVWATFTVKTKSGGMHLYYEGDPDITSSTCVIAGSPGVKIDTRGYHQNGEPSGCVTSPLSPGYEVLKLVAPARMPESLKALLLTHSRKRKRGDRVDDASHTRHRDAEDVSEVSAVFAKNVKALVCEHFPEYADAVDPDKILRHDLRYLIPLQTRNCAIKKAEHSSNHPYIVLSCSEISVRCHDEDCRADPIVKAISLKLVDLFEGFREVGKDDKLSFKVFCELFGQEGEVQAMEYLNNFFAKITHENSVYFCSRDSPSCAWLLRDKKVLLETYEHKQIEVMGRRKAVRVPIIALWMKYEDMRVFQHVRFEPSVDGDRDGEFINLFRGFKAQRLEEGAFRAADIQLLLDHQLLILSNGDQAFYDYTIKWQAFVVQKRQKTTTLIGLNGMQGAGKNLFWEFFGRKVIGDDHYYYCNDMDDLTGQFTGHLSAKLFGILDEVTYAKGHKNNNKLKSLITQENQKLEKKGKDSIMIADYMSMVAFSNEDDFLKVETGDRRYAVQTTSDARLGDHEYFDRLRALINDQHTTNAYITFLQDVDLRDFNPAELPQTQTRTDLMRSCMRPIDQFCEALFAGKVLEYESGRKYEKVAIDHLHCTYQSWCLNRRISDASSCATNTRVFSVAFLKYFRREVHDQTRVQMAYHGRGSTSYDIDLREPANS